MSVEPQTAQTPVPCWSCRADVHGGHFCPSCGRIQALSEGASYFTFFELPPRLLLDEAALEQKFLQLSWKLHPDNFVRASEFERTLSLDRASQLNDAYRTLREPITRIEYLLTHRGVRKDGATKQQAPAELLEEVFELNESLDETRSARAEGGNVTDLQQRLVAAQKGFQEKLDDVDAELRQAAAEWDKLFETQAAEGSGDGAAPREAVMKRMNEILNRRSYIRNLVNTVQNELAQA
jgi:molecular chaperone HscB